MSTIQLTQQQKDQFVVDSEYFTLKSSASFNNSFFSLTSIIQITDNEKVQVIGRTIGRN